MIILWWNDSIKYKEKSLHHGAYIKDYTKKKFITKINNTLNYCHVKISENYNYFELPNN